MKASRGLRLGGWLVDVGFSWALLACARMASNQFGSDVRPATVETAREMEAAVLLSHAVFVVVATALAFGVQGGSSRCAGSRERLGTLGMVWIAMVLLDAVVVFGSGMRCLHDRWAGTFVEKVGATVAVADDDEPAAPRRKKKAKRRATASVT